jgi:hypothetical protein
MNELRIPLLAVDPLNRRSLQRSHVPRVDHPNGSDNRVVAAQQRCCAHLRLGTKPIRWSKNRCAEPALLGASDPLYALLQETVTFTPCLSDPETTVFRWMSSKIRESWAAGNTCPMTSRHGFWFSRGGPGLNRVSSTGLVRLSKSRLVSLTKKTSSTVYRSVGCSSCSGGDPSGTLRSVSYRHERLQHCPSKG